MARLYNKIIKFFLFHRYESVIGNIRFIVVDIGVGKIFNYLNYTFLRVDMRTFVRGFDLVCGNYLR